MPAAVVCAFVVAGGVRVLFPPHPERAVAMKMTPPSAAIFHTRRLERLSRGRKMAKASVARLNPVNFFADTVVALLVEIVTEIDAV